MWYQIKGATHFNLENASCKLFDDAACPACNDVPSRLESLGSRHLKALLESFGIPLHLTGSSLASLEDRALP